MTHQPISSIAGATQSGDHDEDLELIANEYAELLEKGLSESPFDFAARYPEQGQRLLELLKSIRWIQLAARELDNDKTEDYAELNSSGWPSSWLLDKDGAPYLLGDYRLIREVGRGGMGIVYEAEQISLARRVAVKILPPSAVLDTRHVARFAMESQTAAQLQHPNIVPVFAVDCQAGIYFYSMPLIEGGVPHGPLPPMQVARMGACVADALEHAHEMGIIHRDIKPSNLLVDHAGKVWVTDFGLARCRQNEQATASGAVLGTLRYMSPEQASGLSTVDHRSDIYSLGVTLYELLTGRCPYDASNRSAFLVELARGEPVAIRQLDQAIPIDLETIVQKAMSVEPKSRYPTAKDMADDLNRFLNGQVILARRPTLLDRLSKWVARNRRWVTAAIAMWSLVSIAAVFASMMLLKAGRENRRALEQTQKSLEEADIFFTQARDVVDHFGITISKQLAVVPGAESTRREILQDTLRYYRSFMDQAERNPTRQREVALTYIKLGRVAEQMEAFEEAVEAYQRSENLWQSIAPNDAERALNANTLGLLLTKLGRLELANEAFTVAVECNEKAYAAEPNNQEACRRYALTLTNRTVSRPSHTDVSCELESLQKALSMQQSLLANVQSKGKVKAELLVDTAKTYGALASRLRVSDPVQCRKYSQQCIQFFEAAIEESVRASAASTKDEASEDLVLALCNHAAILNDTGDASQAIAFALKATELGTRNCDVAPTPSRRLNLAAAYTMLARLRASQKNSLEQMESFQQASSILSRLVEEHERVAEYRVALVAASFNLHRIAASLSSHDIASAARAEMLTQVQWLRKHEPTRLNQVTDFVDRIQSSSGNL